MIQSRMRSALPLLLLQRTTCLNLGLWIACSGLSGPDAAHTTRVPSNPPPDNLNSSIFLMKPKVDTALAVNICVVNESLRKTRINVCCASCVPENRLVSLREVLLRLVLFSFLFHQVYNYYVPGLACDHPAVGLELENLNLYTEQHWGWGWRWGWGWGRRKLPGLGSVLTQAWPWRCPRSARNTTTFWKTPEGSRF